MQQPLAILFYEKVLPGSLLVNRLQDLKYRVQPVSELGKLAESARAGGPMLILADLESNQGDVSEAIARLRKDPATGHIPIIAFVDEGAAVLEQSAQLAGATMVVTDAAIVAHLPQFLEQALRVE